MGSFDVTCMASNLSIHVGEDVAAFLLVQGRRWGRSTSEHYFYPSERWSVFGMPFFGKYDDYGRIEDVERTPESELTLKIYNAMSGDTKSFDDFELSINGEYFAIDDRVVSTMFIHRAMWDYLAIEMKYEDYDGEPGDTFWSMEKKNLRRIVDEYNERQKMWASHNIDNMNDIETMRLNERLRGNEGESIIGGREILAADENLFIEEYSKTCALRSAFYVHRRIFMPTLFVGEQYSGSGRFDGYIRTIRSIAAQKKR